MPKNSYYGGPVSDHYDGERFFYPGGPRDKSLGELWRMIRDARREGTPWPANPPVLPCPKPPARVDGGAVLATLVGHSTFLIQTGGVNLLTDPVWSDRAGPYGLLGPKRATPPALRIEDLPPLDAILLSHNHYDHLDLTTLSRLARTHACEVLTPLGNDSILQAPRFAYRRAGARLGPVCRRWGRSASRWSRRCTGRRVAGATGAWRCGAAS